MHQARFIFEKDDGLILQLDRKYAHRYTNMQRAAHAFNSYLDIANDLSRWDGHEPKLLKIRPKYQELLAGVYKVYTVEGLMALSITLNAYPQLEFRDVWPQVRQFCLELVEINQGKPSQTQLEN